MNTIATALFAARQDAAAAREGFEDGAVPGALPPFENEDGMALTPLTATPDLFAAQGAGTQDLSLNRQIENQIVQQVADRFTKQTNRIEQESQARIDTINKQSDALIKVKAEIGNVRLAMDNGLEGVESIRDQLRIMKETLVEIENAEEFSDYHRNKFDEAFGELNNSANLYGKNFNPIGAVDRRTFEPNEFTYFYSTTGATQTLQGSFLGSDYRIEADDGTVYLPNLGSRSLSQREEVLSTDDIRSFSTQNGVQLGSYDPTTGAITITLDPNNEPEAVNGTLVKGGLEVYESWFYNDFGSQADIEAAREAIAAAEVDLIISEAQLTNNIKTLDRQEAAIDEQNQIFRDRRRNAIRNMAERQVELETKSTREIQALLQNLESARTQAASYASVFRNSVASNPLLDQLV